jgi:transmembrane sensor
MNRDILCSEDRLCDTALGWIARMRSSAATDSEKGDFALWLAEDESHSKAMDEMLNMWDDLASVKRMPIPLQKSQTAANASRWLAGSLTVAASFALAFFLWPASSSMDRALEFRTAIGERSAYTLEDNSVVTLNTNSKIRVNYSNNYRRIKLIQGEAFFEVAKNPERPFEVNAGTAKVTAVGTAFNIFRNGDSADITVTEGIIQVAELVATGARAPAIEVLHANEYLRATRDGLEPTDSVDTASHIAWQNGKLIAKEMTLRDLVIQLERYRKTRILIADSNIASLTFSGVFELDQPESLLRALELSLGLQVVELGEDTLQLLKTSQ